MTPADDAPAASLDHARLLAEIDAEARRLRSSGELPADYERQLQAVFERFAPPVVVDDDLDRLAEAVDRAAIIDVGAPTTSVLRVVAGAKVAVRKAVAFQVRHVADQIAGLGHTTAQALRATARRLDAIDDVVVGLAPVVASERAALAPRSPTAPVDEVLAALAGVDGRVLHVGAGAGELVAAAGAAGHDAFGTEADERLVDLDGRVRHASAVEALTSVGDATLGAVVMSVEDRPTAEQLRLLDEAVRCVGPGGRIVVSAAEPASWPEVVGPVALDLVVGGPLHAATVAAAMEHRALGAVTTVRAALVRSAPEQLDRAGGVGPVTPGGGEPTAAGPGAYVVSGTR